MLKLILSYYEVTNSSFVLFLCWGNDGYTNFVIMFLVVVDAAFNESIFIIRLKSNSHSPPKSQVHPVYLGILRGQSDEG